MTKPCQHGLILPRGLKCDRGYLILTVRCQGQTPSNPGCGPHTKESEVLARERLSKVRSEIIRGKFGYTPDLPEKTFKEALPLYFKLWAAERNGDGSLKHSPRNVQIATGVANKRLLPFFGLMKVHMIRTIDIEKHRERRLEEGATGTTVNREHIILGSMFSHFKAWIDLEKIRAFKLPETNPRRSATKAPLRKRERLPTDYELKKLKMACSSLQDADGWEIVKYALKTTLSKRDLMRLEAGAVIDTERTKTGVPIHLPLAVLTKLNFKNWTKRWNAIRKAAGVTDLQLRDLRKRGINQLIGRHDVKLVSQFAGHASVATTEGIYAKTIHEKLKPLAEDLDRWVEEL